MIFLTVGTQLSFDRLVRAVDDWLARQSGVTVFGQIGETRYQPAHFDSVPELDRQAYLDRVRQADAVVSHAGMGTIMLCLEERKPLLVLPRRAALGECINDHQLTTARKLEQQGLVQVAYEVNDLPTKLATLRTASAPPPTGERRAELVARIAHFIAAVDQRQPTR